MSDPSGSAAGSGSGKGQGPPRSSTSTSTGFTPPSLRWGGRLPKRHVTVLGGPGNTGKSLLTVSLAAAITAGKPLPDEFDQVEPAAVGIVAFEDDEDTWRYRFSAHPEGDPSLLRFVDPKMFRLKWMPQVAKMLDGCDLVIVDPASGLCAQENLSTNTTEHVAKVINALTHELAAVIDAPVMIIHHPSGQSALSGSRQWYNAPRSVLALGEQKDGTLGLFHRKYNFTQQQEPLQFFKEQTATGIPVMRYMWVNENLKQWTPPPRKPGEDDGTGKIEEQIASLVDYLLNECGGGGTSRSNLDDFFKKKWKVGQKMVQTIIVEAEKRGLVARRKNGQLVMIVEAAEAADWLAEVEAEAAARAAAEAAANQPPTP